VVGVNAAGQIARRLRAVVGTAGVERLGPAGARLVLRELLFDGDGVPIWHRAAACADADPLLFFPDPGPLVAYAVAAAKRICRSCPVRAACLVDVMTWEQPSRRYGVVGGLSVAERHRLHRRGSRASADAGADPERGA
jgi:WhiB family redox-sensing transcriptional regulator